MTRVQKLQILQRIFLQINFQPLRALQFITDHVIFKLRYNQIYQMKTTIIFDTIYTNNWLIFSNKVLQKLKFLKDVNKKLAFQMIITCTLTDYGRPERK